MGGLVDCVQNRELAGRTSPSEVSPAGKLQWHFNRDFDFRHSLRLPFAAAFVVLKGLMLFVDHEPFPEKVTRPSSCRHQPATLFKKNPQNKFKIRYGTWERQNVWWHLEIFIIKFQVVLGTFNIFVYGRGVWGVYSTYTKLEQLKQSKNLRI